MLSHGKLSVNKKFVARRIKANLQEDESEDKDDEID
jgi:hypothetical protein